MLEGKLVRLRAIGPEDAERAYPWINDTEVTQYLMLRYPISLAAERNWAQEAATKLNGFENELRLAVETLTDHRHIGFIGLHRVQPEDRTAELGVAIGDKEFWAKGYGTDAILVLLRFAFYQMNLHRVGLGVFDFNERGMACYQKCGFQEEGRFRENHFHEGRYCDTVRMGVLRREFQDLHGRTEVSAETPDAVRV